MIGKDKKKILFLGHDPKRLFLNDFIHFPIIVSKKIASKKSEQIFENLEKFTYFIFTSRQAVFFFMQELRRKKISITKIQKVISIGSATTDLLKENGIHELSQAPHATAEGVISLLAQIKCCKNDHFFYPHSLLSRNVIASFFKEKRISFTSLGLYTTCPNHALPPPPLSDFEEIFFTSPSTVDAFIEIYGKPLEDIKLRSIGPITRQYLHTKFPTSCKNIE